MDTATYVPSVGSYFISTLTDSMYYCMRTATHDPTTPGAGPKIEGLLLKRGGPRLHKRWSPGDTLNVILDDCRPVTPEEAIEAQTLHFSLRLEGKL